MSRPEQQPAPVVLGVECGGTHSVAILAESSGKKAIRYEGGPANLRLLNDHQLVEHFRKISLIHKKNSSPPTSVAIGMAGARTESDRQRIRAAAAKVWPGAHYYATNDLETALCAAESPNGKPLARVLILSGTGSCTFGQTPGGKVARVGGWGHLIGDKGSGYEIGLRALKAVVYYYDRDGVWPSLGQKILRSLLLNVPNDLIGWAQRASKTDIAALTIEVFKAWANKDKIAGDIIAAAAESLAADGAACAGRLVKKGTPVQFVLSGSVLLKQPKFVKEIERRLKRLWPKAIVTPLDRESVWGAFELARKYAKAAPVSKNAQVVKARSSGESLPFLSSDLPPTERRNPNSANLDQLPVEEMVALMLREDEKIPQALHAERDKIAEAIRIVTNAFKKGGRLFYIGAGTSGRLGVLDASECPPTFRTPSEMVQGVIAGGQIALWKAVEGAEDDMEAGREAIEFNRVTRKDVVVGIAASGRTPYVWGALIEAKKRKAATILICLNPTLKVTAQAQPTIIIAPDVGPEVLTGSTRLKAGTATKLILNMLTTLSMVKLGKVVSNLMVDMNPSNTKLRDRAVRIVQEITGVDADTAKAALERAKWIVKDACKRLRKRSGHALKSDAMPYPVYQTTSSSKTGRALTL